MAKRLLGKGIAIMNTDKDADELYKVYEAVWALLPDNEKVQM